MVIKDEHLESTDALQQMIPDVLSDDELAAAADAASQKRQIAEARAEQWAQVAMAAGREEQHFLEILALRSGSDARVRAPASGDQQASNGEVHPVIAASIAVLEREGRPMHIGQLMQTLKQQGVTIPGSGEQANLISYLRRDRRIVRPSRGMYGLGVWGLKDMAPPQRARKRRTKRRRTKRS